MTSENAKAAEPLPPLGVGVWCEPMRSVGEVVGVEGSRVRLRPLNGGPDWHSTPGDLRYAKVAEIRATLLAPLLDNRTGDAR